MTKTINVYSTEKNGFEDLSNLAYRPFVYEIAGKKLIFRSVEHMYQVCKALFAGDREMANAIWMAKDGYEACRLGGTVQGLTDSWDDVAQEKLEAAMRASFDQNPKAKALLLSTGDALLTHVHPQGKFSLGIWETVFPEILTKLRAEYRGETPPCQDVSRSDTAPKLRGKMTFPYGKSKRPGVTAKNTADAIRNGERTATTRYESDGHLDYWKQAQVGDLIEFTDAKRNTVLVRVTRPLAKLSPDTTAETWSQKEGWSCEYFEQKVLPKLHEAWQIEYELADKSALPQAPPPSAQLSLFEEFGD